MARKVKTLSPEQSKKPGRAPLVAALEEMAGIGAGTFREVEPVYLRAMQDFDALVADGTADQGDIQNGKGDFLNDALALMLANCSGKQLHTRPGVPGLSFRNHKLDVAYPATGDVELVIETKATGIPKHPRNKKQKHPEGRAGSADLEKRIKEASFKNIDIKAEAARLAGKGGGPTTDLGTWLKSAPPRCFLFLAVRVRDAADLRRSIDFGHTAATWFDACGLCCYGWAASHESYESKPVGATSLELDRVLSNVCTALRAMP
ncbi:MAG: hypothetical protein AABM66_07240 [Actinomycetota bacterium]